VGASVAYEAWGDCLGELDEHAGVLRCDIDVDAVRAARSDFWQLADRVLDLPQPSPAAR
jgi:predicted amidohydrolase